MRLPSGGTNLIATVTAAPYTFNWSNVAAAAYTLTAKATDNLGAVTTSAPVAITVNVANAAPTVSLTAPAGGASFTAPADITITADAQDSNGSIAQVEFFQGTTLIATRTVAPYSILWTGVPMGSYSLTARATDNLGAVTTSAPVNVTVNAAVAQMYFIHADHLNTPRAISNGTSQVVWRWDQTEPFGADPANGNPSGLGTFEFNLRLPGQYFDRETNTHYNYFRDYDPGIGRYIQSDPIGLLGGINTYVYAYDPLTQVDPFGLMGFGGGGSAGGQSKGVWKQTAPTPFNFAGGVGAMGMGGTGGGSISAGVIAGGRNVCFYEQVCLLLGYGFAAGIGFEGSAGFGELCSGVYRSGGVFRVAGKGVIGGGSLSTSGGDISGGVGFGGLGGGAAGGAMGCVTRLTCLNPCEEKSCKQ